MPRKSKAPKGSQSSKSTKGTKGTKGTERVRINFVNELLHRYDTAALRGPELASDLLSRTRDHYQSLYDADIKKNIKRKLPPTSSSMRALSELRKRLRERENPPSSAFFEALRMSRDEVLDLKKKQRQNTLARAIDLPMIHAEPMIRDCRNLLNNKNPYLRLLALACLTGRRASEILFGMKFGKPQSDHYTDEEYWTCVRGVAKQRVGDPDAVVSREVPLFERRKVIVRAVQRLRRDLPADTRADVNRKYAKGAQRVMQTHAPEIHRMHDFRKFYVLVAFHYFNERNCSIPRLAADYLGHKTMSDTVITYLSFRVETDGSLDFGVGHKRKTDQIRKNTRS